MPAILCHIPSGSSLKQFTHYGQQVLYGFFGKFMDDSEVPKDFELSQIKIPISIHYSTADALARPQDVERLISKLNASEMFVQAINDIQFNHFDFVWGKNANSLVYSRILQFFNKYQD